MDFERRAAAWLESQLRSRGIPSLLDPDNAAFAVKVVAIAGPYVLGEHAPMVKEVLEAVHESMALEPVLSEVEGAPGPTEAELIKADAQLAASVIEEQTDLLNKEISAEPGKSAAEINDLKQEFEKEERELAGKLDGMARNYFDKHPDLSDDQRQDATKKFDAIKEEELGTLRGQQETRLGERTRDQQQHREDLEERRKELEGTRSDRS